RGTPTDAVLIMWSHRRGAVLLPVRGADGHRVLGRPLLGGCRAHAAADRPGGSRTAAPGPWWIRSTTLAVRAHPGRGSTPRRRCRALGADGPRRPGRGGRE